MKVSEVGKDGRNWGEAKSQGLMVKRLKEEKAKENVARLKQKAEKRVRHYREFMVIGIGASQILRQENWTRV